MKEGWERTVPPMQLDITQIHDMITPVFPRKKVVAAERIGTGLSNTNYKIRLEGSAEPYVLRLFRKGLEIAEKELAIMLTHSNLATPTRMRDLQRLVAETVQVTNG